MDVIIIMVPISMYFMQEREGDMKESFKWQEDMSVLVLQLKFVFQSYG